MSIEPVSPDVPSISDARTRACIERYWRRNVAFMAGLLFVWAAVSLGCGVLFAEPLNTIRLGGFPLGFWFAQQGSILVFVVLILVYALGMGKLDRIHHAELMALARERQHAAPESR
jgi:putative solute:sodium symporter small subunit